MLTSRYVRATIIMMLIWGIIAGFLGTLLGLATFWLGFNHNGLPAWSWIGRFIYVPAALGALSGAGFATVLALRGERQETIGRRRTSDIAWWFLVGTIAGMAGITVFRIAIGAGPGHGLTLAQVLAAGGVFGVISAGVGTGILAIAKRAPALPGENDARKIEGDRHGE